MFWREEKEEVTDKQPTTGESLIGTDMKIDGNSMPVFKWCLQNQEGHGRYLQQGQKVKMGVTDLPDVMARVKADEVEGAKQGDVMNM